MTRLTRSRAGDRGSVALELAVIAPGLVALLGLVAGYGRFSSVTGLVETAARDAARVATQARTLPAAETRAREVVASILAAAPPSCAGSGETRVSGTFEPGQTITVTVSCTVSFGDLAYLGGGGGGQRVERAFSSPLDDYRGVR